MLPIVSAMRLLTSAGYTPLGPLIEQHEFPLLVTKARVVYVAKIARIQDREVLERLVRNPIVHMPEIIELLTSNETLVSIETLVNGPTLAEQLSVQGCFSIYQVNQVAVELLETLQQLARLEIVHRDIKLSNILLSDGHYYLIDVNAARLYHVNQSSDTRLLGTTGFAAPENYGFAQTDHRSDLYALGIVLNCLLTGRTPGNHPDTVSQLTREQPWATIIRTATALDPQQRFQSATAMLAALPEGKHTTSTNKAINQGPLPKFKLRRGLWGTYGLLWLLLILVGFDQPGIGRQWWFYVTCFTVIGLPVVAHLINQQLARHWSTKWQRYRHWYRVGEVITILYLISRFN